MFLWGVGGLKLFQCTPLIQLVVFRPHLRFSDSVRCGSALGYYFGWAPSPLPFKFEISLPNAILTRQQYFFGWTLAILLLGWTSRLCRSNSKSRSTTRFLLHNDIFDGWTPGYFLFVWTPHLCLSISKIRSLTWFLLHNDTLLVGPLGYVFWLDPSPVPFKLEIPLPNAILSTQRYF